MDLGSEREDGGLFWEVQGLYSPGWALTKVIGEPLAILRKHDTLILQVTLVPHEDDLSVVPGVGLDLGGPVEFEGCEARDLGLGERAKVRGSVGSRHSPVLHGGKGLLVGNIIHEQEAHGSPVVGCGDRPVAFLPCRVLGKQWGQPTREGSPHPCGPCPHCPSLMRETWACLHV